MSYLLDTCTLSEATKPAPNPGWLDWSRTVTEPELYASVATCAELRFGTARLPGGARRSKLERWVAAIPARFAERLLPVDLAIVNLWGETMSRCTAAGRPMGDTDALIAATALWHDLTLVTRDLSDFAACGVRLLNPWS